MSVILICVPFFHSLPLPRCTHAFSQYYINSTRGATKVRDISLGLPPTTEEEPSSAHVTRLLASSDGEYIYALTPKKVRDCLARLAAILLNWVNGLCFMCGHSHPMCALDTPTLHVSLVCTCALDTPTLHDMCIRHAHMHTRDSHVAGLQLAW